MWVYNMFIYIPCIYMFVCKIVDSFSSTLLADFMDEVSCQKLCKFLLRFISGGLGLVIALLSMWAWVHQQDVGRVPWRDLQET